MKQVLVAVNRVAVLQVRQTRADVGALRGDCNFTVVSSDRILSSRLQ